MQVSFRLLLTTGFTTLFVCAWVIPVVLIFNGAEDSLSVAVDSLVSETSHSITTVLERQFSFYASNNFAIRNWSRIHGLPFDNKFNHRYFLFKSGGYFISMRDWSPTLTYRRFVDASSSGAAREGPDIRYQLCQTNGTYNNSYTEPNHPREGRTNCTIDVLNMSTGDLIPNASYNISGALPRTFVNSSTWYFVFSQFTPTGGSYNDVHYLGPFYTPQLIEKLLIVVITATFYPPSSSSLLANTPMMYSADTFPVANVQVVLASLLPQGSSSSRAFLVDARGLVVAANNGDTFDQLVNVTNFSVLNPKLCVNEVVTKRAACFRNLSTHPDFELLRLANADNDPSRGLVPRELRGPGAEVFFWTGTTVSYSRKVSFRLFVFVPRDFFMAAITAATVQVAIIVALLIVFGAVLSYLLLRPIVHVIEDLAEKMARDPFDPSLVAAFSPNDSGSLSLSLASTSLQSSSASDVDDNDEADDEDDTNGGKGCVATTADQVGGATQQIPPVQKKKSKRSKIRSSEQLERKEPAQSARQGAGGGAAVDDKSEASQRSSSRFSISLFGLALRIDFEELVFLQTAFLEFRAVIDLLRSFMPDRTHQGAENALANLNLFSDSAGQAKSGSDVIPQNLSLSDDDHATFDHHGQQQKQQQDQQQAAIKSNSVINVDDDHLRSSSSKSGALNLKSGGASGAAKKSVRFELTAEGPNIADKITPDTSNKSMINNEMDDNTTTTTKIVANNNNSNNNYTNESNEKVNGDDEVNPGETSTSVSSDREHHEATSASVSPPSSHTQLIPTVYEKKGSVSSASLVASNVNSAAEPAPLAIRKNKVIVVPGHDDDDELDNFRHFQGDRASPSCNSNSKSSDNDQFGSPGFERHSTQNKGDRTSSGCGKRRGRAEPIQTVRYLVAVVKVRIPAMEIFCEMNSRTADARDDDDDDEDDDDSHSEFSSDSVSSTDDNDAQVHSPEPLGEVKAKCTKMHRSNNMNDDDDVGGGHDDAAGGVEYPRALDDARNVTNGRRMNTLSLIGDAADDNDNNDDGRAKNQKSNFERVPRRSSRTKEERQLGRLIEETSFAVRTINKKVLRPTGATLIEYRNDFFVIALRLAKKNFHSRLATRFVQTLMEASEILSKRHKRRQKIAEEKRARRLLRRLRRSRREQEQEQAPPPQHQDAVVDGVFLTAGIAVGYARILCMDGKVCQQGHEQQGQKSSNNNNISVINENNDKNDNTNDNRAGTPMRPITILGNVVTKAVECERLIRLHVSSFSQRSDDIEEATSQQRQSTTTVSFDSERANFMANATAAASASALPVTTKSIVRRQSNANADISRGNVIESARSISPTAMDAHSSISSTSGRRNSLHFLPHAICHHADSTHQVLKMRSCHLQPSRALVPRSPLLSGKHSKRHVNTMFARVFGNPSSRLAGEVEDDDDHMADFGESIVESEAAAASKLCGKGFPLLKLS